VTASGVGTRELARLGRDHGWHIADRATFSGGVWTLDGAVVDDAFSAECHDLLRRAEERSLWFAARNQLIDQLLGRVGAPSSLWDVGGGNGFVSLHLQCRGIDVVTVEPGARGAQQAADRGVTTVICSALADLKLPDGALEAVGLFDVLEHVDEPGKLLGEVRRVLRPQGLLVVTVPALPRLWSNADVLAGHVRRYRKRDLVDQLQDAAFTVERASYQFAAAVLPVFAMRVLRRGHRHTEAEQWADVEKELSGQSRVTAAVGRGVMAVERGWSRVLPVPFGTSVFCAARP
jgi:SAM-dependent methyltransferase